MNKTLLVLLSTILIVSLINVAQAGNVETCYISIWFDPECTQECEGIDWGLIFVGETVNQTLYFKNRIGSVLVDFYFNTRNWDPWNLKYHTDLTWDAEGKSIPIGRVLEVTFSLYVYETAPTGDFYFDIYVGCSVGEPTGFKYGGHLEIWFYGGD